MAKQKTINRLTTPKGRAKYPWLNKPDTRFNPEGEYKTSLLIPEDEAQGLIKQLEDMVEEKYQEVIADLKENGKAAEIRKVQKTEPYIVECDEEGNPTGLIEFKFKTKAIIKLKNGTTKDNKPKLADAKGAWMGDDVSVYGGSLIRVNFTPNGYFMQSTKQVGVTLYLNAVQVIELVSGNGGSAASYGFEEEEGGYSYNELDKAFPSSNDGDNDEEPADIANNEDF